jgi:hypothetical protein
MHLFESGERAVVILGNNGVIANWSFVECNISGQLKQP